MHDTDSLPLDHLEAVTDEEGIADLAALSDGLRAEREQGITIDVAYRFFSTEHAQLHPRRHPGPRALHPQHVHRRLQRPRRDPPRRRARGRAAPDPTARQDRKAVGHQALRRDGQQDRPGRLRPEPVRRGRRRTAADGRAPRRRRAVGHPDRRQARGQRRAPFREHPLVHRADAAGVPRGRRTVRTAARGRQAAAADPVGVAADRRRAAALHRAAGGRHGQRRRRDRVAARRHPLHRHRRRHPRRRPHDGRCAAVGLDRTGRRHRRRPRRRVRQRRGRRRAAGAGPRARRDGVLVHRDPVAGRRPGRPEADQQDGARDGAGPAHPAGSRDARRAGQPGRVVASTTSAR